MRHPKTNAGSSSPHWGEKEQTVSVHVPLMIRTTLSQNPGILASEGNPVSYVPADGKNNMSSILTDWKPWFGLSSYSPGPIPEILVE